MGPDAGHRPRTRRSKEVAMAYDTDPEAAYQAQLDEKNRLASQGGIQNATSGAVTDWGLGPSIEKAWHMGPGAIGRGIMGTNEFEPVSYKINEDPSERDRFLARQARVGQVGLAGALQDTMAGKGPTVAGQQMQQGIAQALQNAGTQAANARGTSRALAQRSAIYGGLAAQQQANRDAGLLRAQEQLAARGQLGNVLGQTRMGDISTRGQDIGIEQGNQQAWGQHEGYMTNISEGNAQRKQKGTGAVMSMIGSAVGGGALSDIRAKEDIHPIDDSFGQSLRKALTPDQIVAPVGAPSQGDMFGYQAYGMPPSPSGSQYQAPTPPPAPPPEEKQSGGIMGNLGGGMMSGGSILSDRHSKDRIQQLEEQLRSRGASPDESRQNLAPVEPYSYSYKPDFAAMLAEQTAKDVPPEQRSAARAETYADAREPRAGIMAQDLERSPEGKGVVMHTPVGLALNNKRALSFALAQQAGLNKRLNSIEEVLHARP